MEEIKQIWCAEDSCYYPEIKVENGRTYKLDTEHFVYLEQLDFGFTEEEQELMRNPIDRWGNAWRKFMQENYPNEAAELKKKAMADADAAAKAHLDEAEQEKQRILADAKRAALAEKNKVLQEANAQIEEMVSAAVDKLLVPAGSAYDSFDSAESDDSGKE